MRKPASVVFYLIILLMSATMVTAQSALPKLTADLIFTVNDQPKNGTIPPVPPRNILARVKAETLEVVPFYVDDTAIYLRALQWSPKGNLLAILRAEPHEDSLSTRICILTRTGKLQICLEGTPPDIADIGNEQPSVTWSPDEKRIYFVAKNGNSLDLVEADVATGKTLRTLYQYTLTPNEADAPPRLRWTSNLDYVAVGIGNVNRLVYRFPITLHNLQSNQEISLTDLINNPVPQSLTDCDFSPQGNYITLIAIDEDATAANGYMSKMRLIISDIHGKILSTIDHFGSYGPISVSCPTWQGSEQGFYFLGNLSTPSQPTENHIFKYMLNSQRLEDHLRLPVATSDKVEGSIRGPLRLSPDEMYVASDSAANPNMGGYDAVGVIFPDGETRPFLAPFFSSSFPVWVPNMN